MTVNLGFYVRNVESTKLGMLVFSSVEGEFESTEEAFKDLSDYLFLCFKNEYDAISRARNDMCEENHPSLKTPYCPQCGLHVGLRRLPVQEEFEDWLCALPGMELHQWYPDDEGLWSICPEEGPVEVVVLEDGEKRIAEYAAKTFPDDAEWDE